MILWQGTRLNYLKIISFRSKKHRKHKKREHEDVDDDNDDDMLRHGENFIVNLIFTHVKCGTIYLFNNTMWIIYVAADFTGLAARLDHYMTISLHVRSTNLMFWVTKLLLLCLFYISWYLKHVFSCGESENLSPYGTLGYTCMIL